MGVDVQMAKLQAVQLQEYADQLRNAKKRLESYKVQLSSNWIGTETQYIFTAISNQINKLDVVIIELESLQNEIIIVATQIRNEEIAREEAERRAREEAERRAREEAERRAREVARKAAEEEARRKAEAERKAAEQAAKNTSTNKSSSSKSNKNTSSKEKNNIFSWFFG